MSCGLCIHIHMHRCVWDNWHETCYIFLQMFRLYFDRKAAELQCNYLYVFAQIITCIKHTQYKLYILKNAKYTNQFKPTIKRMTNKETCHHNAHFPLAQTLYVCHTAHPRTSKEPSLCWRYMCSLSLSASHMSWLGGPFVTDEPLRHSTHQGEIDLMYV